MRVLVHIRRLFSTQAQLHPYLREGLQKNKLLPLRSSQLKTLGIVESGKDAIINQIDGTGKTLAYLLPIINRILQVKKMPEYPKKSGAIIVALNKEIGVGIYRQIRQLDFNNILNVNRCGSITHYSPVVDQMCKKRQDQDEDLIIDLMDKNVGNSFTKHTDILITTPQTLYKILLQKEDNKQKVSPEFIVVDDADLIFGKREEISYFKKSYEIIKKMGQKQNGYRFIFSSPFDSYLPAVTKYFGLSSLEPTNYLETNKIVDKLKIFSVNIGQSQTNQQESAKKLDSLIKLMKKRLQNRVVIYCSSKSMQQIRTALKSKLDLHTVEYYGRLGSEKRMAAIFDFNFKKSKVLITTQLGSRGFSFLPPIDTIISFDPYEKAQDETVRMCRSNKECAEYVIIGSKTAQQVKLFLNNLNVTEIQIPTQAI